MVDALSLLPEHHQNQFDSRYRIVLIAAQRAKQLMQGKTQSGGSKFSKETSLALEEVLKNQVSFLMGKEARQAIRDAKRSAERAFDPSLIVPVDDQSQEIQKELTVYIDDSPKEEGAESEE